MFEEETAKVYRSLNGRRYFTKISAIRNSVIFLLKQRHEKLCVVDRLYGGEHHQTVSWSDEQWVYFNQVADRYYRKLRKKK